MIQALDNQFDHQLDSQSCSTTADSPGSEVPAGGQAAPSDPFDRIVGQRRAVPFLKEIRDGICLGAHPHPLLFLGRSGHGKTSLSRAFADSIGAEFVRIDCGPELKSEHLVEKLTELKSLAVIFCDELQSMRRRVQEVLFSAIDSCLVPKLENGRLDRCAAQVTIEPFILIGATNEPGRLLPALRSRMVTLVMDDYTLDDLRTIVRQKAQRFFLNLSDRAVDLVVHASGGSPRAIVQILQSVEVTSASWRFNCDVDGCRDAGGTDGGTLEGVADRDMSGDMVDDVVGDMVGELIGDLLASPGPLPDGAAGNHAGRRPKARAGHVASAGRAANGGLQPGCGPAGEPMYGMPCIPDELIERALNWMGLDLAGLDATGRTLLATIAQHGRATAELLATVVGLDIVFTRQNLSTLRSRHLLTATPGRGFELTETGKQLAKELGLYP